MEEPYHIYIIKDTNNNYRKVGISKDPYRRRSELQIGNAHYLELRRIYEVNCNCEKLVHAYLDKLKIDRYGGHGEWSMRNFKYKRVSNFLKRNGFYVKRVL